LLSEKTGQDHPKRDPVHLDRITHKSPPAGVAAVESARPIEHIDRRMGPRVRLRHIGLLQDCRAGEASRHYRLQVSV